MLEPAVSPILAAAALFAAATTLIFSLGVRSASADGLRAAFRDFGQWATFAVAATSMLGSLYYSEVVGFVPCEFCWFQRIAMYPLAILTLIAAITRDRGAARYIVPLATIGLMLSIYHYQLQLFPGQATVCSPEAPCTTRYVNQFGFVSIPFMAGCGFVSILLLELGLRRSGTVEE